MKKCEKCGVPQKDSNFRCIECGAILGDPLSREEESAMKKKISDFIEDRATRTDPFYVSRVDKITVLLDILGMIASVLSMVFIEIVDADALCFIIALIFILGGLYTAFPKIGWFFEKLRVEMLLYNGGRAFHNLACGDKIGNAYIKYVNNSHKYPFLTFILYVGRQPLHLGSLREGAGFCEAKD